MSGKTICQTLQAIYEWAKDWQTLIGALIALVAALWTIRVMREQMKLERDRHDVTQRRKRLAARAQMPDALSELCVYVRGSAACLVGNVEALPEEPISAVATLKGVIELIDDAAAARTFKLVSWYQVFKARMSQDVPKPGKAGFAERQWDVTLLQAYINSLFDYARNETDDVDTDEPTREEMLTAMKNVFTLLHTVQEEDIYVELIKTIDRRHKSLSLGL